MTKEYVMNQEVLGTTWLPRHPDLGEPKEYFMMKDPEGMIYLVRSRDGQPDFR